MPHHFIDMPREDIERLYQDAWGGLVVTPEETIHADQVNGISMTVGPGEVGAFGTWLPEPGGGQVVTLDAPMQGHGFGRVLLAEVERRIAAASGRHIRLFTTNDNVGAIRLYLLSGYRLVKIYPDSMDNVRALKPNVGQSGYFGIPLQDMWEFHRDLPADTWEP